MKKILSLTFTSFILFLFSCTKKENNKNFRIISKETYIYKDIDTPYWYRILEEGDTLILLNKNKEGENGQSWTLVQNMGQKGWITDTVMLFRRDEFVTGSEFNTVFRNFLKDSYGQNDLNKYLHPEIGIYYAFEDANVGYKISKSSIIKNNTPYNKNIPNIYDISMNRYIRCFSNIDLKPGFYCELANLDQIFRYNTRIENYKNKISLPELPYYGAIMKTTLIINNQFESFMYFAKIQGNWYLIMIDMCKCSSGIDL